MRAGSGPSSSTTVSGIRKSSPGRADGNGNLTKMGDVTVDDASLFLADQPVINGMTAIKAVMKPMIADKNFSFTISSEKVDVAKSGDLGYGYGAYTMTMTDPKTKKVLTEKGRYVTVYKKQADGGWKAFVDIDSEDAPPSPAKK